MQDLCLNVHLAATQTKIYAACFVARPLLTETLAQMNTVLSPRVKAEYIN